MGKALYGAEIFAVGTWNGNTFTSQDLDAITTAFDALGLSGRIPLKFGHNSDQPLTDGQPALGWVSRVYRQGDKLLADFIDMPTSIYEMVRAGMYKFVSIELLKNVKADTRTIPWVLDAVALLGADQPAVGTLKDLQSLTLKRRPVLQARARVAFQRDTKFFSTGAHKGMEKHEVEALLNEQATKLTANFSSQLEKLKTDNATALAAEQKKTKDAEIARHRDAIKAKFESAIKAEVIKPAVREQFYKLTAIDTDRVLDIKLEDAETFITDHGDVTKLTKSPTTKAGDKVEHAATNDLEVTRLAVKDVVARGFKANDFTALVESTKIVLKANPKLAKAYIADPAGEYKVEAA